ncbi:MAG TPA: DUF4157 domain-containing protein [Algoriphagus sp.]|nr:DUF4157 domain-containing protein [Algoriphagus sp.]
MPSHSRSRITPKSQPQSADFSVSQNLSNSPFQFQDKRPESVIQRKIGEIANSKVSSGQRNDTGLPDSLKSGIEGLSGYALDDVRVHYNSNQPAQLQAHAFAQGNEIHLGPGQEKHLPHEAWHVVQQKQGRVKPTLQLKAGVDVNEDSGLEREADVMGGKALQRQVAHKSLQTGNTAQPVIQRIKSGYDIQLSPSMQHLVSGLQRNDAVDQSKVDKFVDALKRKQMDWYEDTTSTVLESNQWNKKDMENPFGGKAPMTVWQCPNCKQPTTYQGIHMGHITDWKLELKKAGVQNMQEALMVYNNLLNLRVECASCNVSHAFEHNQDGNFKDVPTQEDFLDVKEKHNWSIKEAKEKHKEFLKGYEGVNLDEYEKDEEFMDESPQEYPAEFSSVHLTSVGNMGAKSGLIHGSTLVTFTGENHPFFSHLQKVTIYFSDSQHLKPGEQYWLDPNKSKQTH